jgi:site-specific recombinase XerD
MHAFASQLLQRGVNIKVASEALGHRRASFTMDVYSHVLVGQGQLAADAIEAALWGDR